MLDGNVLLTNVDCKLGAPHGRRTINDNQQATVTLFRVRMVSGDYDVGGAYWGQSHDPLYAAIGNGFQHFLNATDLQAAKVDLLEDYPELTVQFTEVNDDFVNAYLEAILLTESDNSEDEDNDIPLDRNFDTSDFDADLLKKIIEECGEFIAECGHLITDENLDIVGNPFAQAGHDFWLTRNGHGSGFWDGDWKEPAATTLTNAAHEFGEFNIWVGDDAADGNRKIYG